MKNEIATIVKEFLDGYIKYFLKNDNIKIIYFKSDLGRFRNHLKNQEININEEYRRILQERFSYGTKLGKEIYVKYVNDDSIGSFDYPSVPCYNIHDKKIYLNAITDMQNPRGAGVTWFHEHGHYVDAVLGNISYDEVFRKLLYEDALKYCEDYGRKYHLQSIEVVNIIVSNELNDMHLHSAISDLMEGITDGQIINVAGHGDIYWKQGKYTITREAFAHMFGCQFDSERYKEMKKYCPNSLKYFEKKLKTMKGRRQ
ncbi:MAG: hypothetical protein LUG12_10665 [Erysipelotrichaceae bacterium]|nr:hypothetical protein [Erysipelotrichaceae bacterium]